VYIHKVLPNLYRDSVSLMQLSASLGKLPGVEQASAVMATPANLDLLRAAGLMGAAVAASPNDLLVAVRGKSGASLEAALKEALAALDKPPERPAGGGPAAQPADGARAGAAGEPGADLGAG